MSGLYERMHGKAPRPVQPVVVDGQRQQEASASAGRTEAPAWVQRARDGKLRAKVLAS